MLLTLIKIIGILWGVCLVLLSYNKYMERRELKALREKFNCIGERNPRGL